MVYEQGNTLICGKPIEVCLQMIERFHGWKAPGLVLGLFMVDLAQELIGCQTEADAVVETRHCLPDAIQLFTPCTIGNGWLKILDWDKFAPRLETGLYDGLMQQQHDEAMAIGLNGVPSFVIENKYGIVGAQPIETFVEVIEKVVVFRARDVL